jgi:translocation and assembly module TamB
LGSLDLQTNPITLERGGLGALQSGAWRHPWGTVTLDGRGDIAGLAALFPMATSSRVDTHGTVHLHCEASRDGARDLDPRLSVQLRTEHLVFGASQPLERQIDGAAVVAPPPVRLEGIDLGVDARIDGATGSAQLSLEGHDAHGEIAHLDVSAAHLPYAALLQKGDRRLAVLERSPFQAEIAMPRRALGELPPILRQTYVLGDLDADVKIKGTFLAPIIDVTAGLRRGRVGGTSRLGTLDMALTAHYEGGEGVATARAQARERQLLSAQATFVLPWDGMPATNVAAGWRASLQAHLNEFPLQTISALEDEGISGSVSGDVALTDLHDNARAQVDLTSTDLKLGTLAYSLVRIQGRAGDRALELATRVEHADGFAEMRARGAMTWGSAIVPFLAPAEPLDVSLSSKNFRIAFLLPLLKGTFDELDGRLDSDARVSLDPSNRTARLSGALSLRRGQVEAVAGGGELHDVSADVKLSPDGIVTLQRLTASGVTGKLLASATARVRGTRLEALSGLVTIPSNAAVPLSADGVEYGDIDGNVSISEVTDETGKVGLKVDVPHARIALPTGAATHAQALGALHNVKVGVHRGGPATFVLVPLDPVRPEEGDAAPGIAIQTNLRDVEVVRGTDLKVDLGGRIDVRQGGKPQVSGQIALRRGGSLTVQGRIFTVDGGTVTFIGGDPSNPQIVVHANWTAPDGTVVTASFTGPLKTGKVTLTSEPSLSRQEIVQLLLFGTPTGQTAQSPTPSASNTAIGTAGGELTQPLNHALGQLGLAELRTNVDTSQAANPKPEVEVQIARDISLQIAFVLGQPPPGVNPDHTLVTLEWRFLSRWSLASTVGDAGTAVFDLLWQKRY